MNPRSSRNCQESHAGRRKGQQPFGATVSVEEMSNSSNNSSGSVQDETGASTMMDSGGRDHTLTSTAQMSQSLALMLNLDLPQSPINEQGFQGVC